MRINHQPTKTKQRSQFLTNNVRTILFGSRAVKIIHPRTETETGNKLNLFPTTRRKSVVRYDRLILGTCIIYVPAIPMRNSLRRIVAM